MGQNHSREEEKPCIRNQSPWNRLGRPLDSSPYSDFCALPPHQGFPCARPPVPDPRVAPGRALPCVVPLGGRPLRALVIQAGLLQRIADSSCVLIGRGPGTRDTGSEKGIQRESPSHPRRGASHSRALCAGTRGRTGNRIRIPIRLGTPSPSSPDLQGWIGEQESHARPHSQPPGGMPSPCPATRTRHGPASYFRDPLVPGPLAWGLERQRASGRRRPPTSGAPPLFAIWVNPLRGTPGRVGRRHSGGEGAASVPGAPALLAFSLIALPICDVTVCGACPVASSLSPPPFCRLQVVTGGQV